MASVDTPDDQIIAVNYGDYEIDDWASKHQISLSELASRLDAKQHYDNRGRQIWCDGAEEATIQWNLIHAGGGTIARSNLAAWRGGWSVLMTTGIAAGAREILQKSFYNPETGRYGIEVAWSEALATTSFVTMVIRASDGVTGYEGLVGLTTGIGEYIYQNWFGAFVRTGIIPTRIADRHFWHKMKVVIDVDTMHYVRAMFDGVEIDLSNEQLLNIGALAGSMLQVELRITGNVVAAYPVHFDDFILTHLEP